MMTGNLKILYFITFVIFTANAYEKHLSDTCTSDSHCPANGYCSKKDEGIECEIGKCRCKTGYWSKNSNLCLKVKQLTESCSQYNECDDKIGNVYCSSGSCKCQSKYIQQGSKCVVQNPKKYGESCSTTTDICTGDSEVCISSECKCVTGYTRLNGICRLKKYQESCNSESHCESSLVCTSGKCQCSSTNSWKKLKNSDGVDSEGCVSDTLEIVQYTARNNEACGSEYFVRNRIHVMFLAYCPGDMKCVKCRRPDSSYNYVCRGSAGRTLLNMLLLVISFLLIKSFC